MVVKQLTFGGQSIWAVRGASLHEDGAYGTPTHPFKAGQSRSQAGREGRKDLEAQ